MKNEKYKVKNAKWRRLTASISRPDDIPNFAFCISQPTRSILIPLLLFLCLVCASTPSAQEIVLDSFLGTGARAMGMGGAYTALSDDFFGLFWNPAGLARMTVGEATAGFSFQRFRNETSFYGAAAEYRSSSTRLNAMGIAYPYPVHRGSLVFAGGYGRTGSFDSGLRIEGYDTASQFHKSGVSEDRGALGAFVLGGAVDVAPSLSLGVSLMRWQGRNDFDQELTMRDTQEAHGDTVRLYQRFAAEDRYTAWGLRGGLLYAHPSGVRLGATVAWPGTFDVRTELEDAFEDEFAGRTDTYPTERFGDRYSLRLPFAFGVGIAWTGRGVTVAGDVAYANFQEITYNQPPQTVLPHVEDFRAQYRNAIRYHLGVEYREPRSGLAMRAGYYRDPIRYTGGGDVPEIRVEKDRQVFTLGMGGVLEKTVVLDLAVLMGSYRQIEGSREDRVRTVRMFASVGYRFRY